MQARRAVMAALSAALTGTLCDVAAGCSSVQAHAPEAVVPPPPRVAGPLADIEIIDRDSGARLPIHVHQGRHYVAGVPGRRYAIAVASRSGERVLAVIAVDGINAVSGETAAWQQSGYVLHPWQRYEVRGWRKSHERVAAFEFTALSDSYAARTGRPDEVGVIGVALFRERAPQVVAPPPQARTPQRSMPAQEADASSARGPSADATPAAPPPAPEAASRARNDARSADEAATLERRERLGTGHGRSENSRVTSTAFERASSQPDQVVTLFYDSHANLVARGVIPAWVAQRPRLPQPFPASGFVPDPPPR